MGSVASFVRNIPTYGRRIAKLILDFFFPQDPTTALNAEATNAFKRYGSTKDLDDLRLSLSKYQETVVARRAMNHKDLASSLINYAVATWLYYQDTGRQGVDLDKVIQLEEEAKKIWDALSERPARKNVLLINLGNAYSDKYRWTKEGILFDKARNCYDEVLQDATGDAAGSSQRDAAIASGSLFVSRCEVERTADHLDVAIAHLDEGLRLSKENHSFMIKCLFNLALAYRIRFQYLNEGVEPQDRDIADLDRAIEKSHEALRLISEEEEEHEDHAPCLHNISVQLFDRYEAKKNRADLDEAEKYANEAQDPELELSEGLREKAAALVGHIQRIKAE